MPEWLAPAKVNLSLRVASLRSDGYHPLFSLVQTIDWCDSLNIEVSDEDILEVDGLSVPGDRDNLVWKATDELTGSRTRPPLAFRLTKRIPVAAGLGGGSSDAAAVLLGVSRILGWEIEAGIAARIGADVPFLIVGGTALMEGHGDRITPLDSLEGFAFAVVVPPFGLSAAEVYRCWDELGEPQDPGISGRFLPPSLRTEAPLGNDLTAAAFSLRPEMADWVADLSDRWGRPVTMSGSGPALFGYFADVDEAASAARQTPQDARAAVGVSLRAIGPAPADR